MPQAEKGTVQPVYFDAKDAGKLIGVSAWTIRDLSRKGLLESAGACARATIVLELHPRSPARERELPQRRAGAARELRGWHGCGARRARPTRH